MGAIKVYSEFWIVTTRKEEFDWGELAKLLEGDKFGEFLEGDELWELLGGDEVGKLLEGEEHGELLDGAELQESCELGSVLAWKFEGGVWIP